MNQLHLPIAPTRRVIRLLRFRALIPSTLSLAVALSAVLVANVASARTARAQPAATTAAASAPAPLTLGAQIDSYLAIVSAHGRFSGTVLVARQGRVLLSKGYGFADRARQRPNTPQTPFGHSGAVLSWVGALWLEEHGRLSDRTPICRYLPGCPAAWRPITVGMVLGGTSGLPGFEDMAGGSTAGSLRLLEAQPLDYPPGALVDYSSNGQNLVLALIDERASGQPWATFIRRALFGPAGMAHSGRLTPATAPPNLARNYSGAALAATWLAITSSWFTTYATAPDLYAFDNALYGGRLVSRRSLARLITPRAPDPYESPGFAQARYGDFWISARVAGHRAVCTALGQRANVRFPAEGVTIIVLGNNDQDDVAGIAAHLAALVFGTWR
jgi:CubicO group peptidase (beta-lactamase class C family)